MAINTGNSFGVCEQDASELQPLTKQVEQNIKDCEAQQCTPGAQYRERGPTVDSGFGSFNESTIIANPEVESDDFGGASEAPSVPSEPEAKLAPQQSTASLTSVSATQEQRLLEGTIHQQPGGTVLAEIHRLLSEDQPPTETGESELDVVMAVEVDVSTTEEDGCSETVDKPEVYDLNSQQDGDSKQLEILMEEEPRAEAIILANPQHQSNTEELRAEALDTPDAVVVPLPADDQHTPETVPSPETVATPSEYDKAVDIVEKMDPANWPQPADLQALFEEVEEPTKHPTEDKKCCLGCSIHYKCKGTRYELGYNCSKQKCSVLCKGAKSVFQYWKDGFTPRWKLVLMVVKIILYVLLSVAAVVKFGIKAHQGDDIVFDSISFVCALCGSIVSLVYAIVFCIRRRREVRIILCEMCTWIALAIYKCCCCCWKIKRLEDLKMRREECNVEHEAAKNYVDGIKTFRPAQNCCQKFTTFLGNTSEVLLTIVDDVILTVVFILSLYSFVGKQEFMIFYGVVEVAPIFGFILLVVSALKLIFIVHGIRFRSIAVNVRALDMKVETDSEVMGVKLPNKFIRCFLSFQARLVFHVLFSTLFQIYGIFALSWKIIQDNCSVVAEPSLAAAAGTAGAPFTCSSHPLVNGFTIYNILYIALVPTLLGYTSFFVCNTPWLVEYMQTITMWTYLQIEYTTGHRVREDNKAGGKGSQQRWWTRCCQQDRGQDEVGRDGGQREVGIDGGGGEIGKDSGQGQGEIRRDVGQEVVGTDDGDAKLRKVSESDAYTSPTLHIFRMIFSDLLCDRSDEEVHGIGANVEIARQAIQKDCGKDVMNFGGNFISRSVVMLGQVIFFVPAAIIGALQVVLFIVHLSFLGCCFSSDVHAVFISVPTDIAGVFVPLMILFLMTSIPGPWTGIFWILSFISLIFLIAGLVASVVFVVAVVGALVFGFILLCCLSSSSSHSPQ